MSAVNPKISTITVFKITIFLLIILAGLSIIEFNVFKQPFKTASICFEDSSTQKTEGCFSVELAETIFQQEKGLMYRTALDKDKGMLFVFIREADYPFWMKNTLIPLDMIWIDANSRVVAIKEDAQPCGSGDCPSIDPGKSAKYVLEINGGLAKDLGIHVNDKAILSY